MHIFFDFITQMALEKKKTLFNNYYYLLIFIEVHCLMLSKNYNNVFIYICTSFFKCI
jgi:hypothetical protein